MGKPSDLALAIRRRVIELGLCAGKNGSHMGSAMSIVDLLAVLYGQTLDLDLIRARSPARDRFLLSKGHAAVALFATLEMCGFLTHEETSTFESNGTSFYAHAHRDLSRGIEFSGGSLSLGLPYGVGVALSCRKAGLNNRVFVLVGDGECDEGLIWEAAMAASNFSLGNLTVIVDANGMQSDGRKVEIMNPLSLVDKFSAFGFSAQEIDGHDHDQIAVALEAADLQRPTAIVARTTKGKGVSFMEGNPDWHHGVLTEALFNQAQAELARNH
jgi:transketolase